MNDKRRRQEDFIRNVLDRTSGSPCLRAEDLLPGLVEHRLEDLGRQLVQAHLEHCPGCRAVALALGWLGDLLPGLATIDPGDAFTARVMARTSGALNPAEKAVRAGATIGPAGLMDRVGRWWEKQILKPQFALQFAYVATVILVLLTALPVSPLRGTPEKALQVVQAGPGTLPMVGQAQDWAEERASAILSRPRAAITGQWEAVQEGISLRYRNSEDARTALGEHLKGAGDRLKAGELGEAGYALMQAAGSGRQVLHDWWPAESDTTRP